MNFRNTIRCALAVAVVFAAGQASASDYHFVVANKTSAAIKMLEVSQDKSAWGEFTLGAGGIPSGKSATLVWNESSEGELCTQWIRAKFTDGTYSEASQQDFCQDMDTPIEFTE